MSNFIKRTVPVILVLAVFISYLVSPVSASSYADSDGYDLLDYVSVNDGGNGFSFSEGEYELTFQMPVQRSYSYFEILTSHSFYSGNEIDFYVSYDGTNYTKLVREVITSNFSRFYGDVTYRAYDRMYLKVVTSVAKYYRFNLLSFKCYSSPAESFDLGCDVFLSTLGEWFEDYKEPGSPKYIEFPHYVGNSPLITSFESGIGIEHWKKFDFIDITVHFYGYGFTGIYPHLDAGLGINIPYTYKYVTEDASLDMEDNGLIGSNSLSNYYCQITLDLRDIPKTAGDYLTVDFSGMYDSAVTSFFYFFECYGYLDIPEPSFFPRIMQSLTGWFEGIFGYLESLVDGDTTHEDAAESFDDSVQDQSGELDDMIDIMDSVAKPDVESIDLSVDQYVDQSDVSSLVSPLAVFFSGNIFGPMVFMTILLATVSYILFGKR